MMHDFRFAIRMLVKNPAFTIVAVLTLAVGIGATTAIFSLFDAVLLKSLPVKNAGELYSVLFDRGDEQPPGEPAIAVVSYPCWRQRLAGDAGVIGRRLRVSGRVFTIVGVTPDDSLAMRWAWTRRAAQVDPNVALRSD